MGNGSNTPTEEELEEMHSVATSYPAGELSPADTIDLIAEIRRLRVLCGIAAESKRLSHTLNCQTLLYNGARCVCGASELQDRLRGASGGR